MGTPTPVRNRYLKQSKIMQSIKILIAVLALAGAVYFQEDNVVPEVSSVEETATPVLTSHAKSALIEESSTALSEAHAHLHNDLSHIFKVDHKTQIMSTVLLKTITKNRQDFDNDMGSGASSRRQLPPSPTASPVSVAASPTLLVRHGAPSREALAPSGQPPRRPERGRTLSSRKQPPHSAARASPTSLGVPSMSSSRRPSKCALSSACVSHRTSLSVVGPTQHPSQWLLPSALAVGSLASLQLTT